MILGIDLGTTNSLAAIWRDGAAELVPNAQGTFLTPSAVSIDTDGTVLVGAAARERLSVAPDRTAAAFKRAMGTDRVFRLAGRSFRAEDLSALVLQSLKADAERHLGTRITEAVITVPAYFHDAQRRATKAAGQIAGLTVDRLLNEPTAAALAYGLHERAGPDADAQRRIMVLDLGGGTFDVSILEMFEGVMEVRASAGDNYLGGEDFADAIMDKFIADLPDAKLPPRGHAAPVHAALRRQAEIAKRALTDRDTTEIVLPHDGREWRMTLTREMLEEIAAPLILRLRAPVERALRDSRLHPAEIDHLVLAGGATRMPLFRRFAARLFERLPNAPINPDEVVARGAAVQAGLKARDAALDDVVMTDVAPFTLGIEVSERGPGNTVTDGLYLPILERNTTIPASRIKRVVTMADNQRVLVVSVFQGEARRVEHNVPLGKLEVPVRQAPRGEQAVDVRFTYDPSGVLEVIATNLETDREHRLVIEGRPGVLTPAQIAERLAGLSHLKRHPREDDQNRAILARAERVYEERLGNERAEAARRIDQFRAALDTQDPSAADHARAELQHWLDQVDVTWFT